MTDYVFDNAWERERERLDTMTAPYDDESLRFCSATGLAAGWRCLEVGPGTGRFAQRLAAVVGDSGSVLAVDIDTRLAQVVAGPNLEVAELDVRTGPLPQDEFDLVHARLVVEHLADRGDVIARLVGALKPGGWLVLEDFDNVTSFVCEPPSDTYTKVVNAVYHVMRAAGFDDAFGRRLRDHFAQVGLADIEIVGSIQIVAGEPDVGVPQWELLVGQLEAPMLASGAVTEADLAAFRSRLRDPAVTMYGPALIRARGRRRA